MQSRINYSIVLHVLIVTSVLLALCIACKENNGHNKEIHPYTNALIYETSPYLLQHAHNPVDWRPWSIEALEEAERENKLVLISVGYSSCHWCHVMEKETFENDSIAQLMNENFINIKVDREERPDIDQVYMTALQLIKGQGGWPLNIITLPNGKPLYGGTYHTKDQWEQVLSKTNKLYKDNPLKAQQYANMVANGIQEANLVQPSKDFKTLDKNLLNTGVNQWKNNWDHEWGGDIGSQKFMLPATLNFLLDYGLLTNDEETMAHVELTLDKMAMGGIYDHIGGGFFRYSTDSSWRVPHFEKMLYDNAQLIGLYSKAYKIFRKETYKHIVLGTISFLEREMKNTEGGYYAALDADSGGKEGNYYVWTEKELKSILKNDFPVFAAYYSISKDVVWQENTYILHAAKTDSEFVLENKISIADLKAYKKKWIEKLSAVRQRRIRPRKDDKVITSWNALLISGYIDAYTAFGNKEFLSKAASTIAFIRSKSYSNGKLLHTYKKNNKPIDGFLEDYSFLASACLKMYSVTMNTSHLDFAQKLLVTVEQYFTDGDSGMYTFTQSNELISKIIETNDGVQPSPNAVMANNLFILGHILYHPDAIKKSKKMLSTVASALESNPSSYAQWNSLLMHIAYPFYEIAIVGDNATSVLHQLQSLHIPNALIVGETNESEMPLFKGRYTADGTYIYVCRNNSCKLPVETVEEALGQLNDF